MEQPDLLKFVIQALERLKIPYAIAGSFASGVWGDSRLLGFSGIAQTVLNRIDPI